ncbi:uncharacterized protein EV420DRAFT_258104 [Desarmillaria tabescens]|uniref:Uncharacterized protein n=1 Tax=Armillaria tabescens TaxID=1929756 RepID=A0AA39KGC0_ARMTA|nr:uncharacterized protein EV420DRAFT_258104 [Desarmillaria tabescens]KAK0460283.1 hypothetical protein EV420DRAFT_258104 [Desarmillaria tabescens]
MSNRSSPSAIASNNTAVIAGSVCGALGLVAITAGVSIWIYRRNRDGIPSSGEGDYYTTTPRPYTTASTLTPAIVQSTTTSSRSPGKALTIRQALLRDRAEGLRAQVATLQQNNVEGRLMEENERQRRLILSLERQIRYLTEQQGSAWALGYTDEPPPSYVSGSSSGLA